MKKSMLFCFVIILLSSSLFGDQSAEIKKLEARVLELEKRVEKLEALLEHSGTSKIEVTDKWKNRSLWRQLKVGMTESQVKSLLGEPRKINGGRILTYWYYSKQTWHSTISFDDSGRIYGWTEPD